MMPMERLSGCNSFMLRVAYFSINIFIHIINNIISHIFVIIFQSYYHYHEYIVIVIIKTNITIILLLVYSFHYILLLLLLNLKIDLNIKFN